MFGETLSEACSIGKGVGQGCSLFIIYDEAMVREVCHECAIVIRVGKDSQHDKICRQ